jgi:hypothetical protein
VKLTREQVLAFRVARHRLDARLPGTGGVAPVGLQDTPPGSAALALAARADVPPAALDELVIVYGARGAPYAVAPEDVPIFTEGLAPPDEEAAKALIGNAWKTFDETTAMDALERVSEAVHDALGSGPLAKEAFHQALRERLPGELLWWCRGCGSHHVHPSLWRAAGVRGVLAVVGRDGRSPVYGPPPTPPASPEDPGAELARRFLRANGPATPKLLAAWSGTALSHAKALWSRAGELAAAEVDGRDAWLLAEDAEAPARAPSITGVRLLPNLDPLLTARDRDLLMPDAALRKRLWTVIGGPGAVLSDGEIAGLWRPAKKGKRLLVTVEPFAGALHGREEALAAEAERLAPFRGAQTGEVAFA